ncbi:CG3483 [Drosophila busckii]|uniref:isocitrate dehydrogenase (NAD(+)) n=1 Tax=Drosophila busckii TaxID=30019 RepID=A0A0M3QV75_DROBS|nr:probable isocitrate dehydrogenase [NAD] subunit alpha, mitochondrial [Drosophila busckii]ALC41893.1 CG3483 [Drosophila busckii]
MYSMRKLQLVSATRWLRHYCCQKSKDCAESHARSVCKAEQPSKQSKQCDKQSEKRKVTLIRGLGIGPELTDALQQVCCTANVPIEFEAFEQFAVDEQSYAPNPKLLESLERNKFGIKGPVHMTPWRRQLCKKFGLYAYVSVCRSLEGYKSPFGKIDCVVIRDQVEGVYSGIEHMVVPGVTQTIKVSTSKGANRIAEYVFAYAKKFDRKRITVAHKSNILELTDGNFMDAMRDVAAKHSEDVLFEERYLDTACLNLLMKPHFYEILCSSSMYGDVLAIMGAAIMGGPAMCPGYSVSSKGILHDTLDSRHEELAGKDLANPTGILLSAVIMLNKMQLAEHACKILGAVNHVYKETDMRTQDLGGNCKCSELTQAVCDFIKDGDKQ